MTGLRIAINMFAVLCVALAMLALAGWAVLNLCGECQK